MWYTVPINQENAVAKLARSNESGEGSGFITQTVMWSYIIKQHIQKSFLSVGDNCILQTIAN